MNKVSALFDEIFHAFSRALRYGGRLIGGMSPQALLGAALVLALVCAVLPLALTLFVVFLLVKLACGASLVARRSRYTPYKDVE
ncbi:hypothetical protein KW842_11455 [Duganella sp. sic0402]|uniref:hypothetical protein n=1 Tax=Duganella sp. sic0402 TaxID=2854786 RepID=UPI001C49230D|nr:hypothetical protein [Duganella sp. sic0402]MBV7536382.1 hypothetical protein [Duganella sp. sic0402]